jgi:hypothetical protein
MAEELTLSIDSVTGEYTRLTRFLPGTDTSAFDLWLEPGRYASRPPGELHGPFRTDIGSVVLEVSFPSRQQSQC